MSNSHLTPAIKVAEDLYIGLEPHPDSAYDIKIAGGYLRDTLLGRPIKDCDIVIDYVYHDHEFFDSYFEECLEETNHEDYSEADISANKKYVKDGIIYDLIFVNDFTEWFNTFPINLSKIYYSVAANSLITTRAFVHDAENNVITLEVPYTQREWSYATRIQAKYSESSIVDQRGLVLRDSAGNYSADIPQVAPETPIRGGVGYSPMGSLNLDMLSLATFEEIQLAPIDQGLDIGTLEETRIWIDDVNQGLDTPVTENTTNVRT